MNNAMCRGPIYPFISAGLDFCSKTQLAENESDIFTVTSSQEMLPYLYRHNLNMRGSTWTKVFSTIIEFYVTNTLIVEQCNGYPFNPLSQPDWTQQAENESDIFLESLRCEAAVRKLKDRIDFLSIEQFFYR